MPTVKLRIRGVVQGVGFRYAMREEALRLGVSGWVRNRADGSVEALLQGEPQAVETLVAWARNGPPAARVLDVQAGEAEPQARPSGGFDLLPTV
jgi:acylphosphatase